MNKYSYDKMFSFQYEIVCDSVMLCFQVRSSSQIYHLSDLAVAVV